VICRITASWLAGTSGRATLPATIASVWPTPSGASSRDVCWAGRSKDRPLPFLSFRTCFRIRRPHGRGFRAEDVFEIAVALYAARRELGDIQLSRPVVTVLDEQPGPIRGSASRPG